MKYLLAVLLCFTALMLSCSTLPPEKKFSTTVYLPVLVDGTELMYPCLKYNKALGESVITCPGEEDYPPNPITIDYGNPAGSPIGGLLNELDYQALLQKSCKAWR